MRRVEHENEMEDELLKKEGANCEDMKLYFQFLQKLLINGVDPFITKKYI